jgi:hypothetical protein
MTIKSTVYLIWHPACLSFNVDIARAKGKKRERPSLPPPAQAAARCGESRPERNFRIDFAVMEAYVEWQLAISDR